MVGDDEDKKGYGHPPRHSRFKKGQSGNPSGRPKAVRSFKTDITAELQQLVALSAKGKKQPITRQRALVKNLMAAALDNDMKAMNVLLAWVKHFGIGQDDQASEAADLEDLDLLEDYLTQQRKKQAQETADAASGTAERVGSAAKKANNG